MNTLTFALLACYALAVVVLSRASASSTQDKKSEARDYLLAGRTLTLPAFVATLVTTWYGGILGVGEYGWSYGISTWLVFGVPYYLSAVIFGVWLAPKLRRSGAITIPDLLRTAYGDGAAWTGAAAVFALAVPVSYVLMLANLLASVTGWPIPLALVIGTAFSALYVGISGFKAVVRTDVLQMVLMFGGFALIVPFAVHAAGGLNTMWQALPASHRSWDGGLGWQSVAVWYLIALQTIVEPSFYQRVFAARTPQTARRGVLISVALWIVFDALTTTAGLTARVLLPELANPINAFPALAEAVLPPVLAAVFMVGLFATVMSTLDSYLFIAASTIGHDLWQRGNEKTRTRIGLLISAVLAISGAMLFDSAIQVWHHVGSVVTSALLIPVVSIHLPRRLRFSGTGAITTMILGAGVATTWLMMATDSGYPLGLEPMFPALGLGGLCWLTDILRRKILQTT